MRRSRIRVAAAAAALLCAALIYPALRAASPANAATSNNDVIANLWQWPWPSIGSECTSVLGPAGYGAVQVAPPADSISVAGHPWWDVYQPAGYDLNSRFGNRAQFAAMVSTCHAAGVKVYVDAVINHMTGANQSGTASYGGATFTNGSSYANPGYGSGDFHAYPGDCPESDNQIHNYNSQAEVQECQLVNLSDLRTESDSVRTKIAGYLNDLISLGVDGFRVDAAKHMNVNDVAAIKAKLTNPSVFWSQEVMPGSPGAISMPTYEATGTLLEFNYATQLRGQFLGSISNLQTFGPSWGLEPSAKAVAFVSNHDTERNGSTLSYKNGATDTLANVFMLAWNYGTPNVMSSFSFANSDQSPPADGNGYVSAVTCGSGWECQHRQRAVRNMVGFHNATRADTTVGNWWSDGSNEIAFSRGANGWIAIDNGSGAVTRTFATGLAAGVYCDIIHGDFSGGACSGPTVTVAAGGSATVTVASKDAVAIDVNAKVTSSSPSPTPTGSGVTFTVAGAPAGKPIYLVGSTAQLGSWNTAAALPLTGTTITVAIPGGTAIEYKYIEKDSSGNVTWEPNANHAYTVPASGVATLNDVWNGATPPPTPTPTPTSSTVSVTFNENVTTVFGQNVFLVGSIPALGSWNTANAIPLSSAAYPVWSAAVTLPSGTAIEYKLIKKDGSGTVTWQSGANRTYTTPASGTATVTGSW